MGRTPGPPDADRTVHRSWANRLSSEGWILVGLGLTLGTIATGPLFRFSPDWQFAISMAINIINFLMLFALQRAQRREAIAVQLKLNELVASLAGASNRLIDIESSPEDELHELQRGYRSLTARARESGDLRAARSVEEAAGGAPPPAERPGERPAPPGRD